MNNTNLALPSGNAIDLINPSSYEFSVDELDELLSGIKRFSGKGISVAEHCVMVADTLYDLTKNPHIALLGLLHDCAEAYTGDISTPMKNALGSSIERIESRVYYEILTKFNVINQFNLATQPLIKLVDMMSLHYEYNDLLSEGLFKHNNLWDKVTSVRIYPSMRRNSEVGFLETYHYYEALCHNDDEDDYVEVEYTSLQGKHKCYAKRGTHKLGWTNE